MSALAVDQAAAAAEFYPTPAWVADRILERLAPSLRAMRLVRPGARWLDPCVGDGALPDAVGAHFRGLHWTTCDLRDTGRAQVVGDWLRMPVDSGQRFDVAIMNPPFSKALQFAAKCLELARVTIMLQRVGWAASEERQPWLSMHEPSTYVLPNRPDFDGRGGDSQEYAWFVWGIGAPTFGVLKLTPKAVRMAQKPQRRAGAVPQLDMWGAA